jgi:hypothetical protein
MPPNPSFERTRAAELGHRVRREGAVDADDERLLLRSRAGRSQGDARRDHGRPVAEFIAVEVAHDRCRVLLQAGEFMAILIFPSFCFPKRIAKNSFDCGCFRESSTRFLI